MKQQFPVLCWAGPGYYSSVTDELGVQHYVPADQWPGLAAFWLAGILAFVVLVRL